MSGYVAMSRAWMDHDLFDGDKFSRRDAWAWLIARAAWKDTTAKTPAGIIQIGRGELSVSLRFLAKKWGWSKSAVERFLALLIAENMLEKRDRSGTATGTGAGQQPGHPQAVLSICNYDKFQAANRKGGTGTDAKPGHPAFENRDKEEPSNQDNQEPKEEEENARFAFFGRTVKLTARDLEAWRKRYSAVPDLEVELYSLDAWFETQGDAKAREQWFFRAQSMLGRKNNEILERRHQAKDDGYDRERITV